MADLQEAYNQFMLADVPATKGYDAAELVEKTFRFAIQHMLVRKPEIIEGPNFRAVIGGHSRFHVPPQFFIGLEVDPTPKKRILIHPETKKPFEIEECYDIDIAVSIDNPDDQNDVLSEITPKRSNIIPGQGKFIYSGFIRAGGDFGGGSYSEKYCVYLMEDGRVYHHSA